MITVKKTVRVQPYFPAQYVEGSVGVPVSNADDCILFAMIGFSAFGESIAADRLMYLIAPGIIVPDILLVRAIACTGQDCQYGQDRSDDIKRFHAKPVINGAEAFRIILN